MFTKELNDIFYHYALNNGKYLSKITEGSKPLNDMVQSIMSTSVISPKLREMIVARRMKLRHNMAVNGHDCFDPNGKPWEIKTEQTKRLFGYSTWHYSKPLNLQTYLDQRVLQAGFSTHGKLAYIVSFSFEEAGLYEKIMQVFEAGKVKDGIKYSVSSWSKLDSICVHYSNKNFLTSNSASSTLLEVLTTKHGSR